jgi:predicted ATPase/DNA-binding CsgD family transcriptional regulator
VTQESWAASLGVGRTTVQRWERGEAVPAGPAEAALLAVCRDTGLLRPHSAGPLAGTTLTAEWLTELLAAARFGRDAPPAPPAPPDPPDPLPSRAALPVPLTSFVGRERELAAVRDLLGAARLLTLSGAGGVGKTRLALAAAAEVQHAFPDGVWLAELAAIADPSLVAPAVAAVLGVREQPGRPPLETLAGALRPRRLLLVLDNCEHLVVACATLADALLRTAPRVQVLATSREALGVPGEAVWAVPPLSLQTAPALAGGAVSDAERLFVERARAARPGFAPTAAAAAAAAQVCRRLDGLPLALELAAARVRLLTVEQLAERLDDVLGVLTDGSRTGPVRHQTLRATIDWSHALLPRPERALLRRLAVFAGGFELDAAERVAGPLHAGDGGAAAASGVAGRTGAGGRAQATVLTLLGRLTAKSLVVADDRGATMRYRLLEPIRQYAGEQLERAGEAAALRGRHRDYFLDLAERAEPALGGPDQRLALERLSAEQDNLRAALAWCRRAADGAEPGLRLAAALVEFWDVSGSFAEGREWLTALLARAGGARPRVRAKALNGAGLLAIREARYAAARDALEEGLALARAAADPRLTAEALNRLGFVAYVATELPAARALLREALATAEAAGDRRNVATALGNLGLVARGGGDFSGARARMEQALAIWEAAGDRRGAAGALNNLGVVADDAGDYAAAQALHERSLALKRGLGDRWGIGVSLGNLGSVLQKRGDLAAARVLGTQNLTLMRELGDRRGVASGLFKLGRLSAIEGDYDAARRLLEQGLARYRELGLRPLTASALTALGDVVLRLGGRERARALLEEGLEQARELGDGPLTAGALTALGHFAVHAGELDRAGALLREALAVLRHARSEGGTIECLQRLAELAAARRRFEPAARLLGAVEAAQAADAAPLAAAARADRDALAAVLRAALGEGGVAGALAAGRALTPDEALALAAEQLRAGEGGPQSSPQGAGGAPLRSTVESRESGATRAGARAVLGDAALTAARAAARDVSPGTSPADDGLAALSPREREVAVLVARGLSNRRIGEVLVITHRTAESHVAHILAKLGLTTRAQIAAWVTAHAAHSATADATAGDGPARPHRP